MCGDILSVQQLSKAGLRGIEGVKEAVLWPGSCSAIILKVGCKTLVQP